MSSMMDMLMGQGQMPQGPPQGMDPGMDPNMGQQMGPEMGQEMEQPDTDEYSDVSPATLPEEYKNLLDHVMGFLKFEKHQHDRAELTNIIARLQKLIARNQADIQAVMGGNPAMNRILAKS